MSGDGEAIDSVLEDLFGGGTAGGGERNLQALESELGVQLGTPRRRPRAAEAPLDPHPPEPQVQSRAGARRAPDPVITEAEDEGPGRIRALTEALPDDVFEASRSKPVDDGPGRIRALKAPLPEPEPPPPPPPRAPKFADPAPAPPQAPARPAQRPSARPERAASAAPAAPRPSSPPRRPATSRRPATPPARRPSAAPRRPSAAPARVASGRPARDTGGHSQRPSHVPSRRPIAVADEGPARPPRRSTRSPRRPGAERRSGATVDPQTGRITGARRAISRAEAAALRGTPEPRSEPAPDLSGEFAAVDDLFAGMDGLELRSTPPPEAPPATIRLRLDRPARLACDLGAVDWSSLDPRAGFLVTQADGRTTFDELVIISGLPEADAVTLLTDLVDRGILA